jgi:hypothetical protein
MLKNILFYSIVLLFISSCSNEHKINAIEDELNEAKKKSSSYKKEDWDELALDMKDFERFVEENKHAFSPIERTKANKLIGNYNRILFDMEVEDFGSDLKDVAEKIEGLIK